MPPEKPHSLGDVHAPVEDIDVPFSLKAIVVTMVLILIALSYLIVTAINQILR